MDINEKINLLRDNRWNFAKTTAAERKAKLIRLRDNIQHYEADIIDALELDFKKAAKETYLTEIYPVIHEINFAIKNLSKWTKSKRVPTPITLLGAHSKIISEAKGVVLIMAPWNYPFQLVMSPFVSAISAGCVVALRPSEKAAHTSLIINKIIEASFDKSEVEVFLGDVDVSKALLDIPFDHIFYTGSTRVGKIVMEKAAKNLTTVTLELGGKSPVILDKQVDLEDTVEKIVWGKFINAGQTCVAPDYVFVPKILKESFLKRVEEKIKFAYGETINDRKVSLDYARVIDEQSFDRLRSYIENEELLLEDSPSKDDRCYFPPTVIKNATVESKVMKDEIFGPILPVITYDDLSEVINYIQSHSKPLALYLFSKNNNFIRRILKETTSGGAVVNHVVLHLANPHLPFGGVGFSGMGTSHGHHGFLQFSHQKAVLVQGPFSLTGFFRPPYNRWYSELMFKFLRFLE